MESPRMACRYLEPSPIDTNVLFLCIDGVVDGTVRMHALRKEFIWRHGPCESFLGLFCEIKVQ